MKISQKLRATFSFVLLLVYLLAPFSEVGAAGSLSNLSVNLSTTQPLTASSQTVNFTIGTSSTLGEIDFIWGKTAASQQKPDNLDLTSTALGPITGLNTAWNLDSSGTASGLLKIINNSGETKNATEQISVNFNSVKNPEIGDCSLSGKMYDTCYIHMMTYSDAGITLVDTGIASFNIEDTPSLTFSVDGVASNSTHNGITTNISTTYNDIDFGLLSVSTPKFGAQKLYVETTASHGYTVKMSMDGYLQGLYPANKIDPFAAVNASWLTPQAWETPTGTEGNNDSGWIGANTTDHRVSGWEGSTSGLFGPVSSTKHTVMSSVGKDYGTYVYVSFGMEINQLQPQDSYYGNLLYELTATY